MSNSHVEAGEEHGKGKATFAREQAPIAASAQTVVTSEPTEGNVVGKAKSSNGKGARGREVRMNERVALFSLNDETSCDVGKGASRTCDVRDRAEVNMYNV
ncbi:hypothetical protein M5K25_001062 [Dendrobium thyrsiflorum]|uniref:Uncharacterized protein n=1 Tax=Dendrobium thyrsiflorum TaxID=117978 RepID=A0ABD0VYR5_DENTH